MAVFQFFKMVAVRHLGCFTHVWTTHKQYLVVFAIVQNLVKIGAVDSVICKFQKCLFTPQSNGFGGSDPQNWLQY